MRAAIDDEGGDKVDDESHAGNRDHRPTFDRLRIGKPVDRLDNQIEPDDEQGRQVYERCDHLALRITKGHELVGGTPTHPPREPGQPE